MVETLSLGWRLALVWSGVWGMCSQADNEYELIPRSGGVVALKW